MYLTQSDIIVQQIQADKSRIDTVVYNDLIASDKSDKTEMLQAIKYYDGEHDILNKTRNYYVDGQKRENKTKSNYKLPHPFFTIITKQCDSYVCAKPATVGVKPEAPNADKFTADLNNLLGDEFNDLLSDWIHGANEKGREWVHFYVDEDGQFKYVITPAEEIIPIYDSMYQKKLLGVIRYYNYQYVDATGQVNDSLYKLEYWDSVGVTYYIQNEDGKWGLDPDYNDNPAPHWQKVTKAANGTVISRETYSWGKVPYVEIKANSEARSVFYMIKALIDAYDDIKSGWVDDIKDFDKMILVLKNYAGLSAEARQGFSELGMFVKNLMEHGAILVDDNGGADKLNGEIPVEAKDKFLSITRKEIFYFGMALDIAEEKLGNSPSGTALKFQYSQLDMKANDLITKAKIALKEFFWFPVEWINRMTGAKYDYKLIDATFNKSVIVNEKEIIDALNTSKISTETYLENHPYIHDVQRELDRIDKEEQKQAELNKVDLNDIQPV